MASGALLRRRKLISNHLTVSARCFLGARNLAQGHYTDQLLESRAFSTFTHIPSQEKDSKKNDDVTLFVNGDLLALGLFRTSCCGNGKPDLGFIMGPRQTSQFVRYASTATAGQPNLDGDEERNEELVAKKRKEASAEDCDQAVEAVFQKNQMTLLCVDNSSWMGNGDDSISRRFLIDCVKLICGAILQSNEENAVGLLKFWAENHAVISPTRDIGSIFQSMRGLPERGTLKFDAWMQVAKFLLKDANANQKKRVILFIGGSICDNAVMLEVIGRKLKDSKIHVDAVYFGHEGDETSKLLKYLITAASDDSNRHLFYITPGVNSPFDALTSIIGDGERGMGFAAGYICGLGCEVDGHTKPALMMFNEDDMPDFPLDILIEETFNFSKLNKDSYFRKMKNIAMVYPPFEDEEDVRVMYIFQECRSVDDYQRIKLIASDGSVVYPIYRRCDFYSLAVWTRKGLDVFENKMLSGIDYHPDLNTKILNIGLSYQDLGGKERLNYSLSSMDSSIKVISHGYEVEKHKEYCTAVAVLLGPFPEASKLIPVRDFIGEAFDVGWDSEHFMKAELRRLVNLWAKLSWRIRRRRGSSEIPFFVYRFRDGGDLVEEQIRTYKGALKTVSLLHVPRNKQPGQQPTMFQTSSLVVIGRRLLFSRDNQIFRDALKRYCQETLNDAERDARKSSESENTLPATTLPAIISRQR